MAKVSSKSDLWCYALLGIDWTRLSLLMDSCAFPTECPNQCLRECDHSQVDREGVCPDALLAVSVIPYLCFVNSPIGGYSKGVVGQYQPTPIGGCGHVIHEEHGIIITLVV